MGQAKEVRDLVAGVVNDFVTKNNANTQATILDAIEYSGKTVIAQETIAELGTQHDAFVKELSHIVKDLNRQKLEYNKTVDRVTKQLGDGLKELPRLMAGETSSVKVIDQQIPFRANNKTKSKV
jgi:DNA helicase TIP49 (TBP-interacting protein)